MKMMFKDRTSHSFSSHHQPGLYVHWPFCLAKCPYCDFNSYVSKSVDEDLFLEAFRVELSWLRQVTTASNLSSIFFGGGTPSLMSPNLVASILETICQLWHVSEDAEITLEANPTSVESERFSAYRLAGVNRVSVGVQSLKDEQLAFLGRAHTAKEALNALDSAQQTFGRVSADFIYTLPQQTPDEWREQLRRIADLGLDHLSLYQLTVEEGTRFAREQSAGRLMMPSSDLAADFYEVTEEFARREGLIGYEVSNYARTPEDFSRHNLNYWLYRGYIGTGPGAHGRVPVSGGALATKGLRLPREWMKAVHTRGHGMEACEPLSAATCAQEMVMMGLRVLHGVDLVRLEKSFGCIVDGSALRDLVDEGYIWIRAKRMGVLPRGKLVVDKIAHLVCEALLPAPSQVQGSPCSEELTVVDQDLSPPPSPPRSLPSSLRSGQKELKSGCEI